MRIVVLADIHSNMEALSAVLADAREDGPVDEVWCLGDIVGYGPDPVACIDAILGMNHVSVAGNHDLASAGKVSLADFNPYAAATFRWTASQLSPVQILHMANLPLRIERYPFTLVHGSPRDPIWEYLLSLDEAQACFDHFTTPYCLVGHSHIPSIFRHGKEAVKMPLGTLFPLGKERLIINPGSIGQPRDGDPRASYAIYHQGKLRHLPSGRELPGAPPGTLRLLCYPKEDYSRRAAGVPGGALAVRAVA
ncbi:MAG: metallophosphoesterase family protein [Chloroflexota bacterium]